MTEDLIEEIMKMFDSVIENATIDFKDYEIKRKNLKKKLIKIFEDSDKIND